MLTERMVQNILAKWLIEKKRHPLLAPNSKMFDWESDMVSLSRGRLAHEYEIKCGDQDFLRDRATKENKFDLLARYAYADQFDRGDDRRIDVTSKWASAEVPAYFWYVLGDIKPPTDVALPSWAGVIFIERTKRNTFIPDVLREAQRLHEIKVTKDMMIAVLTRTHDAYWQRRVRVRRDRGKAT